MFRRGAQEFDRNFHARVEQQRTAYVEKVLEVHYRQMLSDPRQRRLVARMIEEVERASAVRGR